MIQGKTVLAIIPARGGSKGVARKNVRPLKGKPLIVWTIETANASRLIDRLIVSSEDEEILRIARQFGSDLPFARPAVLAQDDSPGVAPILHALTEFPGYDYTVVLQPTSPLRLTSDIDACIERCHAARADACVSVTVVTKPPQWTFIQREDGRMEPLMGAASLGSRRQEFPAWVAPNGAVYVARSSWLREGNSFFDGHLIGHEMPPERSLDIDTEWDWYLLSRVVEGPAFTR